MEQYDIAIGLDSAAVNSLLTKLYAKPDARNKFFKGHVSGKLGEKPYTLDWDISQVPSCVLAPPSAADWNVSVAPDGKLVSTSLPSGLLLQARLPEVRLGGDVKAVIAELVLYAGIFVRTDVNALCISPLAINETKSKLAVLDKQLFNALVVPRLFKIVSASTASLALPALSQTIFGSAVTFVKPVLDLTMGRLVLATSKAGTPLTISGARWPTKSVFLIAKPEFVISLAKPKLNDEVKKLHKEGSGKEEGVSWNYSAAITSVPFIAPVPDQPLQVTVQATLTAQASASAGGGVCAARAAT